MLKLIIQTHKPRRVNRSNIKCLEGNFNRSIRVTVHANWLNYLDIIEQIPNFNIKS